MVFSYLVLVRVVKLKGSPVRVGPGGGPFQRVLMSRVDMRSHFVYVVPTVALM